jgi:hypothetical protein
VPGQKYGDCADAAVRRHARSTRASIEFDRRTRLERAIEEHSLEGGKDAAVGLKADPGGGNETRSQGMPSVTETQRLAEAIDNMP